MCLWNPEKMMMSRWRFGHAGASGGDITENQHEENRMSDIHICKRGSETAHEEQPDKFRKKARFEHEAPSASSSSDHGCLWNLLRVVRNKIGWGPSRAHVTSMTTYKFLRSMRSTRWMDEKSLHQRFVGLVSRRRCQRSQEK